MKRLWIVLIAIVFLVIPANTVFSEDDDSGHTKGEIKEDKQQIKASEGTRTPDLCLTKALLYH